MSGTEPFVPPTSGDPSQDPWLSSVVGQRYRIEARIGQGGMGVIYRGQHLELGKRVAIKRLDARISSDPNSFERFRREAITASQIESPHVVHVFDWGKAEDGSPYLVMELLEGCDLRQRLMAEGRLLAEQAATVAAQILRALIHTHHAQIIHRDLKPENVYLCRYDEDETYVKLLDFGISKRTEAHLAAAQVTRAGVVLGTASYMSPEQARGDPELDLRSDLYSVGAILYEMLTGRVPHRGRTYEATLYDICTRDADDIRLHAPLLPEALAKVTARALERDPKRRFQSAKEFLDALVAAVPALAPLSFDSGAEKRLDLHHNTTGSLDGSTTPEVAAGAPTAHSAPALEKAHVRSWILGVLGLLIAVVASVAWLTLRHSAVRPGNVADSSIVLSATAPAVSLNSLATMPVATERPTTLAPPTTTPSTDVSLDTASASPAPGIGGRVPPNRINHVNHAASTNVPEDPSGVLPGLKLRRSMP